MLLNPRAYVAAEHAHGMKVLDVWIAVVFFGATSCVFLLLRSQHYIGDGLRWLPTITESGSPPIGFVRHALFPALGWSWYRVGRMLGYAGDPVPLLQAMNAVAAGLGVGLYYALLKQVTGDRLWSITGCILLAGTNAYSMHATDMTEVMPAVALMMGAFVLALHAAWRASVIWTLMSALFASLAMALNMVSVVDVPAVALLLLCANGPSADRRRVVLPSVFLVACVVNGLLILIGAFRLAHTDSVVGAIQYVLGEPQRVRGAITAGFTLGHLASALLGWAGAVFGLRDFLGMQLLATDLLVVRWQAWWNLAALVFLVTMTGMLARMIWRLFRWEGKPCWPWAVGGTWVVPGVILAWYTVGTYEKIWVHPLAGFVFLVVWGMAGLRLTAERRRMVRTWFASVVVFVVGLNLVTNVAPRHFTPSPYLSDAHRIAQILGKHDLLISASWNDVSVYVSYLFGREKANFDFLVVGMQLGFDNVALRGCLNRRILAHLAVGGRVYLLGFFEVSSQEWMKTLAGGKGLDLGIVTPLQQQSVALFPVKSLGSGRDRRPVMLWEYRGGGDSVAELVGSTKSPEWC